MPSEWRISCASMTPTVIAAFPTGKFSAVTSGPNTIFVRRLSTTLSMPASIRVSSAVRKRCARSSRCSKLFPLYHLAGKVRNILHQFLMVVVSTAACSSEDTERGLSVISGNVEEVAVHFLQQVEPFQSLLPEFTIFPRTSFPGCDYMQP